MKTWTQSNIPWWRNGWKEWPHTGMELIGRKCIQNLGASSRPMSDSWREKCRPLVIRLQPVWTETSAFPWLSLGLWPETVAEAGFPALFCQFCSLVGAGWAAHGRDQVPRSKPRSPQQRRGLRPPPLKLQAVDGLSCKQSALPGSCLRGISSAQGQKPSVVFRILWSGGEATGSRKPPRDRPFPAGRSVKESSGL